jgi:hypothetical protein
LFPITKELDVSEAGKPHAYLDYAVNIAILVAAACLILLVVLRLRPLHSTVRNLQMLVPGQHFPLADLQPGPKGALVLVLQIGCHFCEQSMPFYRTLTRGALSDGRQLVYVMPNAVEDSRRYLQEQGLPAGQVLRSDLAPIEVSGTPTLVLLSPADTVDQVWVGALDGEGERRVRDAVD